MIPHPQLIAGAIVFSAAALVVWLFWMLPLWSRPGIYFAVTVAPEFRTTPEARRLLSSYRLRAMIHVAIGLALILTGVLPRCWPLPIMGTIWLAVGPLLAFMGAHKRVQPHAIAGSTIREAMLEKRATRLPGGWLGQLGPFAILLATAIYLHLHWSEIPSRFPVHWGIDGQPNRWSARTPMGVYAPFVFNAVLLACGLFVAYGVLHSARRINVPKSGSLKRDFARRVAVFVLILEFFQAIVWSYIALLPLIGELGMMPLLIVTILPLPILVILVVWLTKGHVHAERGAGTTASTPVGDGTLDKFWKFGVFYFNPNDAALFVEKRIGVGYTMNFAHALAWIIMALMLLLVGALGLLKLHHVM